MPKSSKFYAVFHGHSPGIYTSWEETQKQVSGFPKAVFKGFPTKVEAENYMKICANADEKDDTIKRLVIYTDGSYRNSIAGAGVYFEEEKKGYSYRYPGKQTISCAELYAIQKALELTQENKETLLIFSDSIYAINILTGKNDPQGKLHENLQLYKKIKELLKGRDVKFQHCNGHVGIEGNELADYYAKKATEV